MNREEAKKRVEELEQERDNIYSAWKGACAWEMESFRELESLKQTQGKVLSVEEIEEIIDNTYDVDNMIQNWDVVATAIHKAQKGE